MNRSIVYKLDDGAFEPSRAYSTDAGYDLRTPIDVEVPPTFVNVRRVTIGSAVIDTGVHILIPYGYVGMLKSKSGLNVKRGITGEGVIDAGYTGSIVVKLYNHTSSPVHFNAGDKIIQLVILPIYTPQLVLVDDLGETGRGDNGFGSSGR